MNLFAAETREELIQELKKRRGRYYKKGERKQYLNALKFDRVEKILAAEYNATTNDKLFPSAPCHYAKIQEVNKDYIIWKKYYEGKHKATISKTLNDDWLSRQIKKELGGLL